MKKAIYILIILVLLSIIIIPFFFNSAQNNKIVVAANLVSALASLITLVIAFLLFDKYGLKKDLVRTQTEIVLQQLESIRTAGFIIRSKNRLLQFFPSKDRVAIYEKFYSEKLIFSTKYWKYVNDIFHLSSSIYMPKEIVEKINMLKPTTISHIKPEETDAYSKVTFWGDKSEDMEFGKMNGEEITLQQFYSYWIDAIDMIISWLRRKVEIEKLNIEN